MPALISIITADTIAAYLAGTLAERERKEVEAAIASDERARQLAVRLAGRRH